MPLPAGVQFSVDSDRWLFEELTTPEQTTAIRRVLTPMIMCPPKREAELKERNIGTGHKVFAIFNVDKTHAHFKTACTMTQEVSKASGLFADFILAVAADDNLMEASFVTNTVVTAVSTVQSHAGNTVERLIITLVWYWQINVLAPSFPTALLTQVDFTAEFTINSNRLTTSPAMIYHFMIHSLHCT